MRALCVTVEYSILIGIRFTYTQSINDEHREPTMLSMDFKFHKRRRHLDDCTLPRFRNSRESDQIKFSPTKI